MTDQELILKMQTLKQIKPSKAWAFSVKMQILDSAVVAPVMPSKRSYMDVLQFVYRGKMAYAFLAMMVLCVGSLNLQPVVQDKENEAQFLVQQDVKASVETFKKTSESLATNPKNAKDKLIALQEARIAAKTLTYEVVKDPNVAKDIALQVKNNGTLLYISSDAEFKEASDELYKTIDEQMIKDLETVTLTQDKQVIFEEAKALYKETKYSEALEKILLISN